MLVSAGGVAAASERPFLFSGSTCCNSTSFLLRRWKGAKKGGALRHDWSVFPNESCYTRFTFLLSWINKLKAFKDTISNLILWSWISRLVIFYNCNIKIFNINIEVGVQAVISKSMTLKTPFNKFEIVIRDPRSSFSVASYTELTGIFSTFSLKKWARVSAEGGRGA